MKKYMWSYTSPNISIRESNCIKLVNKINLVEGLDENNKINKWVVHNYIQNKIKKPTELVQRITRVAL